MPVSPPDEALKEVLRTLRAENPTLGTAKLQAQLLIEHPEWSVSEKRVKKLLVAENLTLGPTPPKSKPFKPNSSATAQNGGSEPFPTSKVIEGLDVARWTKKVKVVDFGMPKGKGLVANEDIKEGEDVWKEDPFAIAPGWEFFEFQYSGHACAYCITPFNSGTLPRSLPCPSTSIPNLPTSSSCQARFCGRLCLSRAQRLSHPLLCTAQNPACMPLLAFVHQVPWRAPYLAAQCIARVLLAAEQGQKKELEEDLQFLDALASMRMEDRWKARGLQNYENDRQLWLHAFNVTRQTFTEPEKPEHKKVLSKILRKPIDENLKAKFFEEESYLRLVAAMTFNMETHGGLYVLHSHLNHSCEPNVKALHFEQKTAMNRITIHAAVDIRAGEELFVTYVNPNASVSERRKEVRAWAFGTCLCPKCVREENEENENAEQEEKKEDGSKDLEGLEEELREGLGLS